MGLDCGFALAFVAVEPESLEARGPKAMVHARTRACRRPERLPAAAEARQMARRRRLPAFSAVRFRSLRKGRIRAPEGAPSVGSRPAVAAGVAALDAASEDAAGAS
jgi:hypothetical protein